MDNEDTDFQSQNFQLAGEDNSKFPSGLRPFVLPKLDIDDGHLQFGTLIDSEVFFSTQGQDTSWIEVFSTGSSVVDFSSSAAESCSISKTNNVWSEATSTESVEMLLKSVGENEMAGNMDSNAHLQLAGMESQIDPLNAQPESSNSPTDNTLVPTENDLSQRTHSGITDSPDHNQHTKSRMTDYPSSSQPQLEQYAPFLTDEKAEQAAGSILSDRNPNLVFGSVDEKCTASEKLSSPRNNTSKSCPAADNYFEAIRDGHSMDGGNMPSAEVGSRKLNNEPFPELAPLQDIYATNSYGFEQDNQESGVGITSGDLKICDISENKVKGGRHGLDSLSCTGQSLGIVNLSSQVHSENLLSESSDGLLEAITNPVKMLHRNDDVGKRVSGALLPSYSPVQHAAENLKNSVEKTSEPVKEFVIGSGSDLSNQPEADTRDSSPHLVAFESTESSTMIQSPERKPAHVASNPEEKNNAGLNNTNILDDDESKRGAQEHHQDSANNLKSSAVEEKIIGEETPAVSGNTEQMVGIDQDEKAISATGASKEELDSSGGISLDKISADAFDTSTDPKVPSVNHEGSLKEGNMTALDVEPENTHCMLPASGPQEEMSAPVTNSGSDIVPTSVVGTSNNSEDKYDCSDGVCADGSPALSEEKNLQISEMSYEGPFKEGAKSLQDRDHNVISSGSEPGGELSAISVTRNVEYKEQANFLGGLIKGDTRDKLGDPPGVHLQKCQLDGSSIQSEHNIDLVKPSSLGVSTDKAVKSTVETPANGSGDLDLGMQDTALSHGADHSSGNVESQVIPGNEPPSQDAGHDSNALVHDTLEQSEDPKDCETTADTEQTSKRGSAKYAQATCSEETNMAGEDRSFSFEVEAPPNVSEKAHSPTWNPFPCYGTSQSTKITTENPEPGSHGDSLMNTGGDSKKISNVEAGKEQPSERKMDESAGGFSGNPNIGDNSETKSSPLEQSQQDPAPECSDLVNLPFTDAQHVQLRAQIFVYGALIQGTAPGEAYMVAAFGEPVDGGKPTWELAWRTALERFQYQKPHVPCLETPTSSHIGSSVSEKASKGTSVRTAAASKRGGKSVLPAHSTVPLHSPTLNAPIGGSTFNLQRGTHLDFSQSVSPVFTHNSHIRQPSPSITSWYSQNPGPRPAPWLVPPRNLIFDSSMQPAVPTSEAAKGASSKNISISHAVSPGVSFPSPAPSISSPSAVIHEEKQKTDASTSQHKTVSQKPRKRKKASASPEQEPVFAAAQLKTDMASLTPTTKHTAGFTLSSHSPGNALSSMVVPNVGQVTSALNYPVTGSMDAKQRNIFSEQIHGAIEQSTGQAKCASVHSIDAAKHKESVWSHLSTISRSKLPPEVEAKLTSAAAAAEAAVSVAKAAAEAAKMASEAALQAKMMAEEALSSSKSSSLQNHNAGEFNVYSNPPSLSSPPPMSSRQITNDSHVSGSMVSVAREVARKRVEEASAAAKRAENLDNILKAAELAAESVFKAGTIIGMGEPLPFTLSDLLEAGPDGYWKSERVRNIKGGSVNDNPPTETLMVESVDVPADSNKSGRKRGRKPKYDQALLNFEPSSSGKDLQPYGTHSGDGVKDAPPSVSLDGKTNDAAPINIIWNGISKGSVVEVLSDKGGFGVAWFSAKVLDINERSALISYENHNEGSGPRQEWLPLKQEGEKAPQIRVSHPATLSKLKTRKRRRETAGNCSWVIGDHVDAWVKDSWREGTIVQNYEADETKFVVQFSAGGSSDSLVVDAWNLRPSLVWKDGQWIEWSQVREMKSKSNKGDTPHGKRQRTCPPQADTDLLIGAEARGPDDKSANDTNRPEEPGPLALSQGDLIFDIGKSIIQNKSDALAFKRPGLQKEGSKVVYGVPRHGKKKKFMEVSKHYVAGQTDKVSDSNASNRSSKHLMPQLPRSRSNTSKVDYQTRRGGETRSRVTKPSKPQNVAAINVTEKDNLPLPGPSSGISERSIAVTGTMTSTSNNEKPIVEKNKAVHGAGLRTEDSSTSGTQAASTVPTAKQSVPATTRAKRKYAPSVDNLSRSVGQASERASSDSTEPRRSNRRIQPTSRLLEGLQSSLIISKVPGEKGPRSHYKPPASRGKTHG